MWLRRSIVLVILVFSNFQLLAQNKSKKELRTEKNLKQKNEILALVESRNFEFVARRAIPQGFRTMELDFDRYTVQITPENIISDLPFFGRAYSVNFGSDTGLKFEGKPSVFEYSAKKKSYRFQIEVKGENDFYKLLLEVSGTGYASLSVISNNRATINYDGVIKSISAKG